MSLAFQQQKMSDSQLRMCSKKLFYSELREHPLRLLKSAGTSGASLLVMIRGEVYDLAGFVDEHPGGRYILQEVAGKDATTLFERASHSAAALVLSRKFCVWSALQIVGKKGMPFSALK